MSETKPTGKLTFPCEFTIKVFGHSGTDFESNVINIVKKHVPTFEDQFTKNESRQAKYLSLSVTIIAESQKQLDDLYRELSSAKDIVMVL